ncbi:sacsin-like [Glandiceps talaboti]
MDCKKQKVTIGKSFGQRPPTLLKAIKGILEKYPEGGQIIKELIQNAEDAGASEVKFLLDITNHGEEGLLSENIAKYQGPALYCYNNATFQKEDWDNIQSLQDSIKKKDPSKVGRFGCGFVSVYHLTDMPSVMSGDTVAFFDPFENQFNEGESGRAIGLAELKLYRNQFIPFTNVFGIKESKLLSFPLCVYVVIKFI